MNHLKESHSYLLRLWQTRETDHLIWHILLENPTTREVRSFNCTEELSTFLTQIMHKNQMSLMAQSKEKK